MAQYTKSVEESEKIWDLLAKFSSFSKLILLTAYCLRFISKLCLKLKERAANSTYFVNIKLGLLELPFLVVSESFTGTSLSRKELENARLLWVFLLQASHFRSEIQKLRKLEKLSPQGSIVKP